MTQNIRDILVISDIDGTLVNNEMELPGCNMETIRLFTEMGGNFTVATGRTVQSVGKYPELVEYLAPAITSGGTVIYDYKEDRTTLSELLPRAVAKKAMREVMRKFPEVGVMVFVPDSLPYVVNTSEQTQKLLDDEHISFLVRPFEELPADWNKVIFAGPPALLAEIEEYIGRKKYPGVYFVLTSEIYFEMMPEGVSKGSALEKLCELLGVDIENTVMIGDYYNDLDIMGRAGRAVAMENAPVDVIMKADEVTGSNQQGGVGQFLYKLMQELDAL